MTRKLNGHGSQWPGVPAAKLDEMQKTVAEFGSLLDDTAQAIHSLGIMLLNAINALIPNANVDLDALMNIDAAIERVFRNPHFNATNMQLGATVGIMAFAVAQTIRGKARGYPEFNNCSSEFTFGEDEYRARMCAAPMFEQLDLRIGFNRSTQSKYKTPAVKSPEKQLWINWLFSQYVFTAALYGGISEADAEAMRERWVSVQWDWLHTDPPIANMDFKRYWSKRSN